MPLKPIARARIAWCLCTMPFCFLLALVQATARSSEARPTPRPETSAERTRKALEQIVTFDLLHHPLSEVVRLLMDQTGVRIVLDRQGLSQFGINPDEVIVSTKLTMTLGSSLRQILSQYNMDYAIISDMVLITTEELALQRQMRQPVRVRFDRLQLKAALDHLARETATNLVLDSWAIQYANTPVSLNLDDAPLEVIVKLLAYQAGLKQIRVGNVMMVTTKTNAAELRDDSELPRPTIYPPVERQIAEEFLGNPPLFVPAVPALAPAPAAAPAPPPAAVPPAPPTVPADKKEEKKEDKQ